MRIGNVITDEKVKLDKKFNISNSLDDIIDTIPTLIIGLDNAKKLNTKLNYLDRKIDDNTFWTFNKKEKRVLFEEDLFYFYALVIGICCTIVSSKKEGWEAA